MPSKSSAIKKTARSKMHRPRHCPCWQIQHLPNHLLRISRRCESILTCNMPTVPSSPRLLKFSLSLRLRLRLPAWRMAPPIPDLSFFLDLPLFSLSLVISSQRAGNSACRIHSP